MNKIEKLIDDIGRQLGDGEKIASREQGKKEEKIQKSRHNRLIEEIKKLRPEKLKKLKVWVENQQKFPKEIKVSNFPKQLPFPKEIGIKEPRWYKTSKIVEPLLGAIGGLAGGIGALTNKTFNVKIDGPRDPADAIAVRLSDGKRFYKVVIFCTKSILYLFPFINTGGHKQEALVDTDGHIQVDVLTSPGTAASTTPVIYNIAMTNINTEYSQALPAGEDRFSLQSL